MAKYCREKFERTDGVERIVCWRQDKHVHNSAFIITLEQWLGAQEGGTWTVRVNSYQSNQSSCGESDLEYDG